MEETSNKVTTVLCLTAQIERFLRNTSTERFQGPDGIIYNVKQQQTLNKILPTIILGKWTRYSGRCCGLKGIKRVLS